MESSKGSGADVLAVDAANIQFRERRGVERCPRTFAFSPTSKTNLRVTARIKMCVSLTPYVARGVPGKSSDETRHLIPRGTEKS